MSKEGNEEVLHAIENLIRLATRHKVAVAGFAFAADDPMVSNFGNVSDHDKLSLYTTLVRICEKKRERGESEERIIEDVN